MDKSSIKVSILKVDPSYSGQRIDNFLIRALKPLPKSLIYRLIRQKKIRLNTKRVKPDHRLQSDDQINLPMLTYQEKIPLKNMDKYYSNLMKSIIVQNDDYLVLNKPANLACHGGSGLSASVIDILKTHDTDLHLVHRLDKATSGCLLIAKNRSTLINLQAALRERAWDKYYLCIVKGVWPKKIQKIDLPLQKITFSSGERRVQVDREQGKNATTLVRRLACNREHSLLAIKLVTGRMHQIRVHCQAMGHPVLGDEKYAKNNQSHRLYLHAAALRLGEESRLFTAPLDKVFQSFCEENELNFEENLSDYF